MPVQVKTVEIDGEEYEMTQLGALKGRKLWLKILHIVAPAIKELGSDRSNLSEAAILAALSTLVDNLDEQTTEHLYETFGAVCVIRNPNGNKPALTGVVFDQHFAGRYVTMSKWLWECIVFNFASFLGDTSLGSMLAQVKGAASMKGGIQSPSHPGSIGSSGGS